MTKPPTQNRVRTICTTCGALYRFAAEPDGTMVAIHVGSNCIWDGTWRLIRHQEGDVEWQRVKPKVAKEK
jgi:hypothetical protein